MTWIGALAATLKKAKRFGLATTATRMST